MSQGILVFGASGSGTTSLAKVLCEKLQYPHYDLDHYLWDWSAEIPFTKIRPRQLRIELLMQDISKHPHFVMSGSMDSYNEPFIPLFELVVFNSAPTDVRLQRVHLRELSLFKNRILDGGDMAKEHQQFLANVASYEKNTGSPSRAFHQQWANSLPCPVVYTDGTLSLDENAKKVIEQYNLVLQER